jgi:hypothetical protein
VINEKKTKRRKRNNKKLIQKHIQQLFKVILNHQLYNNYRHQDNMIMQDLHQVIMEEILMLEDNQLRSDMEMIY